MARGIIYVMTTVVPGLIKIGKTGSSNYEKRMYNLEHNGYFNVAGLQRRFAIEVEDYDEKERLLDEIFSKSQVPDSELFAMDVDLVIKLLASFEGTQVYPKTETKEQSFVEATISHDEHEAARVIPDGEYHMSRKIKRADNKTFTARMVVHDGTFVIPKGERVCTVEGAGLDDAVRQKRDECTNAEGLVTQDAVFRHPSPAGSFIIGGSCGGWVTWKNASGDFIDIYRPHAR